jgi:hypothetical protein
MQYLTWNNLAGVIFVLLIAYSCVHFKNLPKVENVPTKLAFIVLAADATTPDINITEITAKSLKKTLSFVGTIEDGQLSAETAFNLLKALDMGNGKTMEDVAPPSALKALSLLLSDIYIDLEATNEYSPLELKKEFAKKFTGILRETLMKLE